MPRFSKTILSVLLTATGIVSACSQAAVCAEDPLLPGPMMRPGQNCIRCHKAGGEASNKPWTAAGTIYNDLNDDVCSGVNGVDVVFLNAQFIEIGRVTSNTAGNFYTNMPLPQGFRVAVERGGRRITMPEAPAAGSCNACHSDNPVGNALGPIRAP
jgi:cytochrome c553